MRAGRRVSNAWVRQAWRGGATRRAPAGGALPPRTSLAPLRGTAATGFPRRGSEGELIEKDGHARRDLVAVAEEAGLEDAARQDDVPEVEDQRVRVAVRE